MKTTIQLLVISFLISVMACNRSGEQKPHSTTQEKVQSTVSISTEDVIFKSDGIKLAGTIYRPTNPQSAIVLVHGSEQVPRMTQLAKFFAQNDILVFTYDKRGVGASGGVYAGPEVGTNNISTRNLNKLAIDASSAVNVIYKKAGHLPIGLVGASQAGWIIPIVATKNPLVEFMVLFSCPTITTLEQLRFQFYTIGRTDFWEHHTEEDAREHIKNDPDRYQFIATDPKDALRSLTIPGLWLFGEKDIQIPVTLCIEQLSALKQNDKPYEYVLFPSLGHNTYKTEPIQIAIDWIKQQSLNIKN